MALTPGDAHSLAQLQVHLAPRPAPMLTLINRLYPEWVEGGVRVHSEYPKCGVGESPEWFMVLVVLVNPYPRLARLADPNHAIRPLVDAARVDELSV